MVFLLDWGLSERFLKRNILRVSWGLLEVSKGFVSIMFSFLGDFSGVLVLVSVVFTYFFECVLVFTKTLKCLGASLQRFLGVFCLRGFQQLVLHMFFT